MFASQFATQETSVAVQGGGKIAFGGEKFFRGRDILKCLKAIVISDLLGASPSDPPPLGYRLEMEKLVFNLNLISKDC